MTLGDQYPGQPYGHGYGAAPQGPSSGGVYGTPRHEPGHGQSGHGQPGHGQPGQGQPGHGQPGASQPAGQGHPGYGQPAAEPPGYGQPPAYGQPADPYGQPPRHGQPDPYGQPPRHGQSDPYGQPAPGQAAPGQPGAYGQPSDPYGVPAAPGFGGAQFAEPPGFGPPPPPPKGGSRFWLTTLAVLAVVVVIAACSVGGYFMFRDDGSPTTQPSASASGSKASSPSASPSPTSSPVDISSRTTDPKPLTEKELFGDKTLTVSDDSTGKNRSYKVVKTQALESCKKAVTGDLGGTLSDLGCNQVVRAAINSSDGKYGATAGVFNLKNKGHSAKIDPLIKDDKGSFNGLEGPGASAKINKASLMMYWEERGHYMVYVIICRGDGKQVSSDDPRLGEIGSDLLISHLATKLAERTGTVD